jgi:short-subunit dehydrogenase
VIITGATGGIGAKVARTLLKNGKYNMNMQLIKLNFRSKSCLIGSRSIKNQ